MLAEQWAESILHWFRWGIGTSYLFQYCWDLRDETKKIQLTFRWWDTYDNWAGIATGCPQPTNKDTQKQKQREDSGRFSNLGSWTITSFMFHYWMKCLHFLWVTILKFLIFNNSSVQSSATVLFCFSHLNIATWEAGEGKPHVCIRSARQRGPIRVSWSETRNGAASESTYILKMKPGSGSLSQRHYCARHWNERLWGKHHRPTLSAQ